MSTQKNRLAISKCISLFAVIFFINTAYPNNIIVTNVVWNAAEPTGTSYVKFDLSWENSWRATWVELNHVSGIPTTIENWDAAWVFVKYRVSGGEWNHATLSTNATNHRMPAGATNAVGLTTGRVPGEGVGTFIYRDSVDHGTNNFKNIQLLWLHELDNPAMPSQVDLQVHAIEMVYIPEGSFKVGDGGNTVGHLYEGGGGSNPFAITNAGPIECDNVAGKLWGSSPDTTMRGMGGAGIIPSAFPNGYRAFYSMKYQITEGQYVAFLNSISQADANTLYPNPATPYRHTITRVGVPGDYVYLTAAPDRACNYITWTGVARHTAWIGLRPITELEFEKACRGPVNPILNDRTWGTAVAGVQITNANNDGQGDSTPIPANAHWHASTAGDAALAGAVRVGIFATSTSDRVAAGATYWGLMEMGGNLHERLITIALNQGRQFQGTNGDGTLTWPADWPQLDELGISIRGGGWYRPAAWLRISYREQGAGYGDPPNYGFQRLYEFGGRGGRDAP